MKANKYIKYLMILSGIITLSLMTSCEDMDLLNAPRLFRPVSTDDIIASGNTLYAKWSPVKGATSYTIEASRDTFKTITDSVVIAETAYTLTNLQWYTLYQIRIRANSDNPDESSKYNWIGSKKTEKFPTIMATPSSDDLLDTSVKVKWTNSGAAVTRITATLNDSIVKEVILTDADRANQFAFVTGLKGSTTYLISLYSGDATSGYVLRGYDNFTTKATISANNIVDLRDSTRTVLDATFLATVPAGSTLLLKGGQTYDFNGALAGDITITTGYSFNGRATLRSIGAFNFTANVSYGNVTVTDVNIIGDATGFASRYLFNINVTSTASKITVSNCSIKNLRGVLRTQAGPQIDYVAINNCIVDSIGGYAVINCDNASSKIAKMEMTNSTLVYAQKVFVNTKNLNTTSIIFKNNTVCFAPLGAGYIFDMTGQTATVDMDYNIFGPAWPTTATPPVTTTKGFRGTLTFLSGSNYITSDVVMDAISALPNTSIYSGTSTTLWKNPVLRDFNFIDSKFTGKYSAGDPRWFAQ